jgi:hypothetical protein
MFKFSHAENTPGNYIVIVCEVSILSCGLYVGLCVVARQCDLVYAKLLFIFAFGAKIFFGQVEQWHK